MNKQYEIFMQWIKSLPSMLKQGIIREYAHRPFLWMVIGMFLCIQVALAVFHFTFIPVAPSYTLSPGAPEQYIGEKAATPVTFDPAGSLNVTYAFDTIVRSELQKGELPLWNANQAIGQPLAANAISGGFYPVTWITAWASPTAYEWLWVAHWLLAGIFLYAYLRKIGKTDGASAVGFALFVWSGTFSLYLPLREYASTIPWFIATFWVIESIVQNPSWKWRHAVLSIIVSLFVLAGQPETAFIGAAIIWLYGVVRLVMLQNKEKIKTAFFAFIPGVIGAIALSAPLWLSFFDYGLSAYSNHPHGSDYGTHALPLMTTILFLFPVIRKFALLYLSEAAWVWPGALLLIALYPFAAFKKIRSRAEIFMRIDFFWIVFAVLYGAKIFGISFVELIGTLPLFDRLNIPRYGHVILIFALSILAASAANEVWQNQKEKSRHNNALLAPRVLSFSVILFAWIGIASLWLQNLAWPKAVIEAFAVLDIFRMFIGIAWLFVATIGVIVFAGLRHAIPKQNSVVVLTVLPLFYFMANHGFGMTEQGILLFHIVWMAMSLGFIAAMSAVQKKEYIAVIVVVAVFMCAAILGYMRHQEKVLQLPERYPIEQSTDITAFLSSATQHGERVYSFVASPQPNFGAALGIPSINSIEAVMPKHAAEFYLEHLDSTISPLWFAGYTSAGRAPGADPLEEYKKHQAAYQMISVRYIVLNNGTDVSSLGLSVAHEGLRQTVWEDPLALPRVFIVPDALWNEYHMDTLSIEDVRAVLAEHAEEIMIPESRISGNTVSASWSASQSGMLVVMDAYDAGWHARINNNLKTTIQEQWGAFRSVHVSAEDHSISMTYRPLPFVIGAVLWLFAVVGIIAITLFEYKKQKES